MNAPSTHERSGGVVNIPAQSSPTFEPTAEMRSPLYNLTVFKFAYVIAQLFPRPFLHRLANRTAVWSLSRTPELRRTVRDNLAVVTGRSGDDLDALVLKNMQLFGRMLADYFIFAGTQAENAGQVVDEWEGWQHLADSRARGNGTILITGHLGHWELGGLVLAVRGLPITVVTLPEPTAGLTKWREASRRRLGIRTIAVGPGHDFAFLEMLRVLRENGTLAMLVDRPYSGTGMPVTQFGRETQFSTAAAMLAHHTGATIVPAFVLQRTENRYRAIALPPVELDPGLLRQTLPINVQRIATLFASLIRTYPEQWFNYVPLFSPS